jgi:hypothetical protein
MVMRQAFAGLLWSKQLFYYDVARWLDGDPAQPAPPQRAGGRNSRWRNFNAFDIMSMPDKWEYPWFAAWDLCQADRRQQFRLLYHGSVTGQYSVAAIGFDGVYLCHSRRGR